MLASRRYLRRLTTIAALAALPLLAACGDDDDSKPRPTATATQAVATATATRQVTNTSAPATATAVPATATAVPPTATAVPPTATATNPPTATSTAAATDTPTVNPGFRDLNGAAEASFAAHGSVNQVYITGATEGDVLELVGADSVVQQNGTVDAQGALIFRNVDVGSAYRVVAGYPDALSASPALAVTAINDPPDQSFYSSQVIPNGYGYLTTRDGTQLSISVYLPGPIDGGPYPTVIEYSGYDPANPDAAAAGTLISRRPRLRRRRHQHPRHRLLRRRLQFFEPLQWTDSYDAIGSSPRSLGEGSQGRDGRAVLSRHLAALRLSSAAVAGIGGAALDHRRHRPRHALPRRYPQQWLRHRLEPPIASTTPSRSARAGRRSARRGRCDLHQQPAAPAAVARHPRHDRAEPVLRPEVADPVTPTLFVHNINVPVFLAHAWQDEQIGGYAPNMIDHFTGTDKKHFTLVNGGHSEPLIPAIFHRWIEFLSFYVRKEVPQTPALAGRDPSGCSAATSSAPPADAAARSLRRHDVRAGARGVRGRTADPRTVRVGTGDRPARQARPGFEHSFDSWPIRAPWRRPSISRRRTPESDADLGQRRRYVHLRRHTNSQRGSLASSNGNDPVARERAVELAAARRRPRRGLRGAPLTRDTCDRHRQRRPTVRASAPDVDLQVTLSEIRPDGQENYIQNGWLRTRPPRARRGAVLRAASVATQGKPTRRRCPPACSLPCGSSSSRSRTRSAPARASACRSNRRVAIAPSGSSTPCTSTAAPRSRSRSTNPASSCRSYPASTSRPSCRPARRCALSPAGSTKRSTTRSTDEE